jgi:hypothetical protein
MYPLHSDDFFTGFPSRFSCSSLLCHPNIRRVFRRLCLLLNVSNGVLRARNVCSIEGIFDRNCFELLFSGQQRLRIIRVRASVPRIAFFGPAAPSYYSSAGFGPLNCLLRASSAFVLFECGLRSLELPSSGQQRLRIIRVRASVPRIAFFGPAAPSYYLSAGFGPSNCLLWASSAFVLFECGLRSLELFLSGRQRLQDIRGRASAPRIVSFGPAAPSRGSRRASAPRIVFSG